MSIQRFRGGVRAIDGGQRAADVLKDRMKSFESLDTNKDNKLSVEEFIKVVEPPVTPADAPGLQFV